ncbi:MAG TPA: SCO family protein [Polyangiaceae bacterium]
MARHPSWFDRTWGRRLLVSALASVIVASLAMLALLWGTEHRRSPRSAASFAFAGADGGDLPELWRAPSFALVDQHGRPVTLDSLRGAPFIADFIFTQCTSACPMLTSRMMMLQRTLAGQDVRFVSFSVDPAHDTPAVLAAYAARWSAGETRWTLVATSDDALAELTSGFRVETGKTHDPDNPIFHSDLFFLVDGAGLVRGVYPSIAGDAMTRLAADARRLSSAAMAGAEGPRPDPSKDLYTSLGCPGCHENAKLAPPLVNLPGTERTLQDGSRVKVDDAYLRRAILEPGVDVVADYPPIMPSYRQYLNDAQVEALVAELDARTADASTPEAEAAVVVDPVCRMKVRAVPEAPHVTFQGKELYFCSDTCRDAFTKHPKRYPLESVAGASADH